MSKAESEAHCAIDAATTILSGRTESADLADTVITLEKTVSIVLLAVVGYDSHRAARLLDEVLVPALEMRFAALQEWGAE